MKLKTIQTASVALLSALILTACTGSDDSKTNKTIVPADKFDLSQWKINIPTDNDNNGKVDEINTTAIQTFSHSDYFYLDENNHMVFATPNKAFTTPNSSNTRSELHQMFAPYNGIPGDNNAPDNNFALKSHKNSAEYAQIGGNLQATLKVNHVAKRAKYPNKYPAHSVVVGQIHASKYQAIRDEGEGFGWGNEPIKIYFKKWPNHEYGSVFWNYELNLPKKDPNRKDIAYPVWGNTWENPEAPGEKGIKLDEEFSYEINVFEDTMYLTFTTARHEIVKYSINLADNVDAYGEIDRFDHPLGYAGDIHYFKAGAYNQCSTKDDPGFWYAACLGTGDWQSDKANGDYAQVTFSRLVTGPGYKVQ